MAETTLLEADYRGSEAGKDAFLNIIGAGMYPSLYLEKWISDGCVCEPFLVVAVVKNEYSYQ